MNYKEFNISLPVDVNNVVLIDGIVQYDTANIVNVRLMSGIEPFDFTGYTEVFIDILKPDGNKIQSCVTDDPSIINDNDPYTIQVVDPAEGRISFTLQGQATVLEGTHFGQIMISGNGKTLTSTRFNYRVGENLSDGALPDNVASSSEYASLLTLINRNSAIATAERDRMDSETLRRVAELAREERIDELEEYIREYLTNAEGYVNASETAANIAEQYAQLAQNPSAELLAQLITDMDLASVTYVDNKISDAVRNFIAGLFTDTEDIKKLLKFRTGDLSDLPVLDSGEPGFATDAQTLFIGTSSGNIPINGTYQAGDTAPERTDILWIDTSAGGTIKYHNGTSWEPAVTVAFA
ncbi:MAG: BppU family phage baseplate upper protein [Bacillota bacterium]|nr:BppU family phage baseplate upper protein [Bacillota bacterium]